MWSAVLASATVVGLLALGVAVEVWGRGYMAEQVEAQLRASGITGDIEVSTVGGWRPVVLPALVGRGLEELHIATSEPVPVDVDGEPIGFSPLRVRVLPQKLAIAAGEARQGAVT